MRVLLVEDDEGVRSSVAETLSEGGFEVLEAASGDEALQYLTGTPSIAILVTDLRMPGMTGWEVARRVRTVLPDVPVIYATGYVEAMEPPVTGSMFLLKPYRVTQLVSAIRALTEKPLIEASRRPVLR